MADTKVSGLTAASSVTGSDTAYVVQSSTSKKAALSVLASYMASTTDGFAALANSPVSVTTGTALSTSAFGKLHVCSGTSADYTVTLPDPTSNANGIIALSMAPGLTKLVTIAQHASETIDGTASRIMWAGETAILRTDGTNWFKLSGKSIPFAAVLQQTTTQSISGSYTQTVIKMDAQASGPAAMFDGTNGVGNILRGGVYGLIGQGYIWRSGGAGTPPDYAYYGLSSLSPGFATNNIAQVSFYNGTQTVIAGAVSATFSLSTGDVVALTTQTLNAMTTPGSSTNKLYMVEHPQW
jgi:hypothetical protein